MKRFLYLFIIIAAVALVILIGYFLRQRAGTGGATPSGSLPNGGGTGGLPPTPTQAITPTTPGGNSVGQGTTGSVPQAGPGQKFGVVAQNQVLNFYVDKQNNVILVQPDGQIAKVSSGNVTVLSSSAISNLIRAEFSYDGTKILASFGDPDEPQVSIFDVASKSWQPLAGNLKAATWSPSNYQIAYFADKNGVNSLNLLDTALKTAKPVELIKLHEEDLTLNWILPTQIIMSQRGSAYYSASIWSFDVKNKTLHLITGERMGLDSIWSGGAGMGLVISAASSLSSGRLSLFDAAGNNTNDLAILTLPSKCTFDVQAQNAPAVAQATSSKTKAATSTTIVFQKSLYCGIPRDSQKFSSSQLPDSYETLALITADDFYKIDLQNGSVTSVFSDQSQTLDATDMKIANQTLFFINRIDKKLYAIMLE